MMLRASSVAANEKRAAKPSKHADQSRRKSMKFWRHLLICALALTFSGCGTTVNKSLKVEPASRTLGGCN